MKRRTVVLGLGVVTVGTGVGTGAFSQVSAERTVAVDVAGDDGALLTIEPNPNYNGDATEYAELNEDGLIELAIENANQRARTTFDALVRIRNQGSQDVGLFVDSRSGLGSDSALDFAVEGQSIVGQSNAEAVDSGGEIPVDVVLDFVDSDEDDIPETITLVADADVDGPSGEPAPPAVTGTVSTTTADEIVGATVELWHNGAVIDQDTTDSDGEYTLSGEDLDTATVVVSTEGDITVDEVPLYAGATRPATTTAPVDVTVNDDTETAGVVDAEIDGESVRVSYSIDETQPHENPIATVAQLQAVSERLTESYTLVRDLDTSQTADWNDGDGFEPIGDDEDRFTGTLNGAGYTIERVSIDRESEDYVGLIGVLGSEGEITNVESNVETVEGRKRVGGLVGANAGTVRASFVAGRITGKERVGGLVGVNGGIVDESHATGDVATGADTSDSDVAHGHVIGGLVGTNSGTVRTSSAIGDVDGTADVGGLVGRTTGTVTESYASGDTEGDDRIGGLVGQVSGGGEVNNSYSIGDTTGARPVGGLAGSVGGTVRRSYATGEVTGEEWTGGLAGSTSIFDGTVTDSYWDTGTTTQNDAVGDGSGENLTGFGDTADTEPAAAMQGDSAQDNMDSLDFTEVWATVDGDSDHEFDTDGYPIVRDIDRESQLAAQDIL